MVPKHVCVLKPHGELQKFLVPVSFPDGEFIWNVLTIPKMIPLVQVSPGATAFTGIL